MKPTLDVLRRREEQAIDGAKAWNEYLAAPDIAAAKTTRLRQERLEREALEQIVAKKALSEAADRLKRSLVAKKSAQKKPKTPSRRKTKLVARHGQGVISAD